jgi:hypothetical protein
MQGGLRNEWELTRSLSEVCLAAIICGVSIAFALNNGNMFIFHSLKYSKGWSIDVDIYSKLEL